MMQTRPGEAPQPHDPASTRDATPPAVLNDEAIPELGQAKPRDDVTADPGLMPGLRTSSPLPASQPVTPEDRSTQFVPVEGGDASTSAEALLVAAYAVMWALLLLVLLLTWRRQRRLEQRVNELERRPGAGLS
jgi:hypothetical protein